MAGQLNLFAGYTYTDRYWSASPEERRVLRARFVEAARGLGQITHFYQVFPARSDLDVMLWTAQEAERPEQSAELIAAYARAAAEWRAFLAPTQSLWGFTRPSVYSRGKSEQDIDPVEGERAKFLIVYPFSKTKEWYLMSMDARQGMMNEHIKIGKQYFDVKQLLVYSFGLQDQEFVVSYEVEELQRFSELVNQLRNTEGRRHTLLDTPIITGLYRTPEEMIEG